MPERERKFNVSRLLDEAGRVVALGLATAILGASSAAGGSVDFASDILPIFERQCYECHGPKSRKGDLRLSNEEEAFRPAQSGVPVIERSDSSFSLLVEMVSSTDPDERMPKGRAPLTPQEIRLIRDWIDQGAVWGEPAHGNRGHWAYRAPARPQVPAVALAEWPRNEIDRFILAAMEKRGLSPSPPADEATLLRRVFLDLIGLPPTPQQQAEYFASPAADRFESVVDDLLASPAFGERWATSWLDLARYADSNGFQADRLRENAWPFRDWVIRAINEDRPFDRFVIEQLAGDLLPEATRAAKIASGFQRNAALNLEAGIHAERSRFEQIVDRVNTFGTAFLGTTFKCAQCHDHKYDPITTREYYEILAFFNNTTIDSIQLGSGGVAHVFGGSTVEVPLSPARQKRLDELTTLLANLKAKSQPTEQEIQSWVTDLRKLKPRSIWTPVSIEAAEGSSGESFEFLEDKSVLVSGPVPESTTYEIDFESPAKAVSAVKVEILPHRSLPGGGPGRGGGDEGKSIVVLSEVSLLARAEDDSLIETEIVSSIADLGDASGAFDGFRETGWRIGRRLDRPHFAAFSVATPLPKGTRLRLRLRHLDGFFRTIGRLRVYVSDRPHRETMVPPATFRLTRTRRRNERQEKRFRQFVRDHLRAPESMQQIRMYEEELERLEPVKALVMEELGEPRTTRIAMRGEYLNWGEEVDPATPGFLPAFPAAEPRNRLGLARWLVNGENPLVARVATNRWWANIFGRGIVATPEDFGIRGMRPSHPRLLDWLATELRSSGWSRKHVVRKIVTSSTYRQSAARRPAVESADPGNQYLTRSPRYRLAAELIRDQGLAAGGLLSATMEGPPIYPPQPDGLWNLIGPGQPVYRTSKIPERYRRSVYVIRRRSAPPPNFALFDSPDRSLCVAARETTNTPLQALALLNDPNYVAMSAGLASRILRESEGTSDAERMRYAFRVVLARDPLPEERALASSLLAKERERLAATKRVATGKGVVRGDGRKAGASMEVAAWYGVASSLLALDETVSRP